MKNLKLLYCVFFCMSAVMYAEEYHNVCMNTIEQDSHTIINDIFMRAQESIIAHEDIITVAWLTRKEIKEIQHLMSDAYVVLDFDCDAKKVVSEKLQTYLQTKIRDEAAQMFDNEEISVEAAKQFFYLSRIVCELGDGHDCRGMMRTIKNENSVTMQHLKIQKKLDKEARKQEMRQLRERIILGAHPRK